MYHQNSFLFIDGKMILPKEGTTQGDPFAIAMYAIVIIPLIQKLQPTGPTNLDSSLFGT